MSSRARPAGMPEEGDDQGMDDDQDAGALPGSAGALVSCIWCEVLAPEKEMVMVSPFRAMGRLHWECADVRDCNRRCGAEVHD
jgi:hypothetical protein